MFLPDVAAVLLNGDGNDIIGAAFGLGYGVYAFFRGFRLLRNKRLVENTPTSRCRSVAMGLCEVAGRAKGDSVVPSLIGAIPSFCTKVKIERYQKSGKNSRWVKVHEAQMGIPFFLEDDTGRIKVDPTGAELDLTSDLEYATDSGLSNLLGLTLSRMPAKTSVEANFRNYCAAHGVSSGGRMRFFEWNLCPDDPCYVFGSAEELPGVADEQQRIVVRKGKHHPWYFIAEASEKEVLSKLSRHTWLHIFGGAALSLVCLAWLLHRLGMLN